MTNFIYEEEEYSENELYSLLDLSGDEYPTNLELETAILIKIQNSDTEIESDFYKSVYSYFFDISLSGLDFHIDLSATGLSPEEIKEEQTYYEQYLQLNITNRPQPEMTNLQSIIEKYYPKDDSGNLLPSGMELFYERIKPTITTIRENNPIIRDTVTYQLLIRSDARIENPNSTSTNFSIQLQKPLNDVLKLSLYGVTIPYSWYTIGKTVGANFFLIKGNREGINTGNYDFKIEIEPGNYSEANLINAVQNSFLNVIASNPDICFGNSGITYNAPNSTTNFLFDITQRYNESDCTFLFSNWSYTPYVDVNLSVEEYDIIKSASLASFLGFRYSAYSFSSIYSNLGLLGPDSNEYVSFSKYWLDNSNNYFTVIAYEGPEEYDENRVVATLDVILDLSLNRLYTQKQLFESVNRVLLNQRELNAEFSGLYYLADEYTSDASFSDVSNGYYFEMSVVWNRAYYQVLGSHLKTAIQFPNESYLSGSNNRPVWTNNVTSSFPSCFRFNNRTDSSNLLLFETGNLIAHYPSFVSVNTITDAFIGFKCINPIYDNVDISLYEMTNGDLSYNHFRIGIEDGEYTFVELVDAFNNAIIDFNTNHPGIINIVNTRIQWNDTTDYKMQILADINKEFGNTDYLLQIVHPDLQTLFETDANYNSILLSIESIATVNSSISISTPNQPILRIKPNSIDSYIGNVEDGIWTITIPVNRLYTNTEFANTLQSRLLQFEHPTIPGLFPLTYSSVSYNANTKKFMLNLVINVILTENQYRLIIDTNLATILKLAEESDLVNYNVSGTSYAVVVGTNQISENRYKPSSDVSFAFLSYADGFPNRYVIDISANSDPGYLRDELISIINTKLTEYDDIKESICGIKKINGQDFVYFRPDLEFTYGPKDYKISFFNSEDFVGCSAGTDANKRIVTKDFTLGWMMGFREYSEYDISELYPDNMGESILFVGEYSVLSNIYNNIFIVMNDNTNSGMDDGLHLTLSYDGTTQLPQYQTLYKTTTECDPDTGLLKIDQNQYTEKGLYSAISNATSKKTNLSTYSSQYSLTAFAVLPVKTTTLGQNIVDTGGSLSLQNRNYVGPTVIRRLDIRLVDERGLDVDLNGAEWSFIITVERLYVRSNPELIR